MKEEVKTTLNPAEVKAKPVSKTRFVVFVGLCIAIMAVSAWVVIPFGPIPFTLQIFAVAFAILVLPPKQCMAAVGGYLLLGAIGVFNRRGRGATLFMGGEKAAGRHVKEIACQGHTY